MGNKANCCAGGKPQSDKDRKYPRIEDKKNIVTKKNNDSIC